MVTLVNMILLVTDLFCALAMFLKVINCKSNILDGDVSRQQCQQCPSLLIVLLSNVTLDDFHDLRPKPRAKSEQDYETQKYYTLYLLFIHP